MLALNDTTQDYLATAIEAFGSPLFSEKLYAWLCRCVEIDNGTILAYYQWKALSASGGYTDETLLTH